MLGISVSITVIASEISQTALIWLMSVEQLQAILRIESLVFRLVMSLVTELENGRVWIQTILIFFFFFFVSCYKKAIFVFLIFRNSQPFFLLK